MPKEGEPLELEEAQEEARQIKDIVGPKGTSEEYSIANALVGEDNKCATESVAPEKPETDKADKINDEVWQERMDTAFQQNDYELIKTLQKIRPESSPKTELILARLQELITTRSDNWAETFGILKSILQEPELIQVLVAEEFGKLFEKFGKEKHILAQLEEFKKATRYVPSPQEVQAKYRSIFAGLKSYDFDTEKLVKDIEELTGIAPSESVLQEIIDSGDTLQAQKIAQILGVEFTSEMIQRSFKAQFDKDGYLKIYRQSEITEKPNPELVQSAYQKIIEQRKGQDDRWIEQIQYLRESTEIEPVFTQEQMRPIFEEYLGQGRDALVKKIIEATNIRPDIDIVEKRALKIIDNPRNHSEKGKGIIEAINRLRENTGINFEIPESEIQERYQTAIATKKPYNIIAFYSAFGIIPSIDREMTQKFMRLLLTGSSPDLLVELETIFGTKLEITAAEVASMYQECLEKQNLETWDFDYIVKIQELTGMAPDSAKIQEAIERYAEQQFTKERNSYYPWHRELKKVLEKFSVSVPEESISSFYRRSVEGESIDTAKIKEINELFGRKLPADLAQNVYKHLIHAGGFIMTYLESVYELSGNVKPDLSLEEIHAFNLSQLEDGWPDQIDKLAEITGVTQQFTEDEIHALYKRAIFNGKAERIANIKKYTGIELKLDAKTAQYVHQKIQDGINGVADKKYIRTYNDDQNEFDYSALQKDLQEVVALIEATGIKPDENLVQDLYQKILAEDHHWISRLEIMVKSLGVQPSFPTELIRDKCVELLAESKLNELGRLLKFIEVKFSPEDVELGYRKLLDTNQRYDEYSKRHYYCEGWLNNLKQLQNLTGIPPTEVHLTEIFLHILKDARLTGKSSDPISIAIGLLEEYFGATVSETIAQVIYKELFDSEDLVGMGKLKEKTGLVPEVSMENVKDKCDGLLQKRDFQTLWTIRKLFNLDVLPITPAVVQSEYMKLINNPKFATYGGEGIKAFYTVFELTNISPKLSPEQISMIYRRIGPTSYEKFEQVVGVPPAESDFQNQIYNLLIQDYIHFDSVSKFMEKYKVAISPEIARAAVLHRLGKVTMNKVDDFIKNVKLIEEILGSQIRLEPGDAEAQIEKIIRSHKPTETSCLKLDDLLSWFEEYTEQKPSQAIVDLAYMQTLGQTISYKITPDGQHLKSWDWLKQNYGLPSPKTVQRMYLAQLTTI